MDIELLRFFVEVARCGSVTAASRELQLSQPTLSRRMRRLENELGVKLLDRRTDGMVLTVAGRKALAGARSTVRSFDEMAEAVAQSSGAQGLRLGMPPSAMALLLDALMVRLHRPGNPIRLSVTEGTNASLLEAVRAGQLDIAVATEPPSGAQLRIVPLWTEQLFFVGAQRHGALPEAMSLAQAAEYPLILGRPTDTIRQSIERAFREQGLAPQVAMELEGIASIKRLLESRRLWTFAPWLSVQAEVAAGKLVCCPMHDLWIHRCAITVPGALAHPNVRAVLRLLAQMPRELLQGAPWARMP